MIEEDKTDDTEDALIDSLTRRENIDLYVEDEKLYFSVPCVSCKHRNGKLSYCWECKHYA